MSIISLIFLIVAILIFIGFYVIIKAPKQSDYMNDQFVNANERSKQALAHEREWVEQMEKFK